MDVGEHYFYNVAQFDHEGTLDSKGDLYVCGKPLKEYFAFDSNFQNPFLSVEGFFEHDFGIGRGRRGRYSRHGGRRARPTTTRLRQSRGIQTYPQTTYLANEMPTFVK